MVGNGFVKWLNQGFPNYERDVAIEEGKRVRDGGLREVPEEREYSLIRRLKIILFCGVQSF